MFSLSAVFSLVAALSLGGAIVLAFWKVRGWSWQWIGGWAFFAFVVIPFFPLKQSASDDAARNIRADQKASERRAQELPPRVEVDLGRDFGKAREEYRASVQEISEANQASQKPQG